MQCPKCNFTQPTGPECLKCGIIFDKYRAQMEAHESTEEDPKEYADAAPAPAEPVRPPAAALARLNPVRSEDPFQRPIRTSLRIVRTGAGVLAIAFGSWLFLWGQDQSLEPFHVLLLIAYGCVGLFWILSAPLKVSVKQFAIEMLLFVFATVLLKVALPEAFDLGTLSNRKSGPLAGGHGPGPSETSVPDAGYFVGALEGLASKARDVLDAPQEGDGLRNWLSDCAQLKLAFRKLNKEERKKVEKAYKATVALEQKMEQLAEDFGEGRADAAFGAVEALEKALITLTP